MRYRRLQYRYTMVLTEDAPHPARSFWPLGGVGMVLAPPRWRPDTDVYETEAAIVLVAELAGMNEDDIEVQLFEDALVVEGQRALGGCEPGGVYHAVGIRQGAFRLEVPLTVPVESDRVEARYERGLLRIRLPKRKARDSHGR
jgi:HSP20 family protein